MTGARLRVLYALVLDRCARASQSRVAVPKLLALVEHRGSEPERLETLDHVMQDRDRMVELDVLWAACDVRHTASAPTRP